jgi:lipoic acid synthetase
MRDLRDVGVDIVTVGQYLRPTPKHATVDRYVTPEQFKTFENEAHAMGFRFCASGPLVRSSYKAAEVFVRSILRPGDAHAADELLRARLEEAQRASLEIASADDEAASAPRTTSELAARTAATLVPVESLVRRNA